MLINKFREEPQFNVIHSIKKIHFSLWGYHNVFYLFMIIFRISVTESINLDRFKNSATQENASISIYQKQGKTNSSEISLSMKFDGNNKSLGYANDSSFYTALDEMENTDNEPVFFAPVDLSKQDSQVIDLGQKSSYLKKNNKGSFLTDNSVIMPFLNAFNSTGMETQQPETYYDYLYELAMNMSHVQETNIHDSQCQGILNSSLNNSISSIEGHVQSKKKP